MSIDNIMSRDLVTLGLDSTLYDAKKIFEAYAFHHIIIVDDSHQVTGLLTDREVYKHLSPSIGTSKETKADLALLRKPIHMIMTRKVVTGKPDLTLNETAFMFYKKKLSCMPIVDENNTPIGIVTWRDLMKVIALQFMRRKLKLTDEE